MPAIDSFQNTTSGLDSPLRQALAIVPSDAADLPNQTRALHIGTGGAIRVTMAGGDTVTFTGIAAGWHPIRVVRVHATGTTASNIIGCW